MHTGFYACLGLHGFLLSPSSCACWPLRQSRCCGYILRLPAFTAVLVFMASSFLHRVALTGLFVNLVAAVTSSGCRLLQRSWSSWLSPSLVSCLACCLFSLVLPGPGYAIQLTGFHACLCFHGFLLSLSSLSRLSNATCRPNPCQILRLAKVIGNKGSTTWLKANGIARRGSSLTGWLVTTRLTASEMRWQLRSPPTQHCGAPRGRGECRAPGGFLRFRFPALPGLDSRLAGGPSPGISCETWWLR